MARLKAMRAALAGTALAALALPGAPLAQTAQGATDEDAGAIVVTARRVEERLQDVPIAVSALGGADLARQQLDDLSDIAEKTVGFAFENFTGITVQPVIRGQTNLRIDSPVLNVAFYLDGVYLQRGYFVDQSLLELERVEIIKGPQSALYGRNAFAGAVNMVSRRPDLDDWFVKVGGTVGNYDRYDWRAAFNLPILPDRLAVFFNYAHSEFDGSWKNNHPLANERGATTRGRLGGWDKDTYQARVLIKPTNWLTLDAEYIRTDRLLEAPANYTISTTGLVNTVNTLNCSPRAALTPPFAVENRLLCGEVPVTPSLRPGERRPPGLVIDPRAFSLKGPTQFITAKAEFAPEGSPITATYQFGFTKANVLGRGSPMRDPTTPVVLFGQNFGTIFDSSGTESEFKGASHEVRFTYTPESNWRALVGFNYSYTRDINSNASESAPTLSLTPPNPNQLFPIGPGLPFPSGFFQRNTYIQRTENIFSAFFFLGWKPTDRFELSFEGRYTKEDLDLIDFLTRDPANPAIQASNPFRSRRDTGYFTPRITGSFRVTPDNLLYASVARGVKSGGLNGNTPFVGQRAYQEETNWTYEIGAKNQFFDRALTLNVAAYYTDWQDLQTTAVRLTATGGPPNFIGIVPTTIGNIGGVNVWGLEAEGAWRITPALTLDFGASYNRSRYKDGSFSQRLGASQNCDGTVCAPVTLPGQPFPVLLVEGNQLERVPEIDSFAGLTFEGDLPNGWGFFVRGDVTYQTKIFLDETNLNWVSDRLLANASAGLSIGPVDLRFWVKNLADKKYVSNSLVLIGTGGALSASYVPNLGDRRTFGVTGSVAFGPGARR